MKNLSNKTIIILIIIIAASNIAWGIGYFKMKSVLRQAENEFKTLVQNKKILAFQRLFVDKVLKSSGIVDFDTRVMLQNSVNATGDNDIISTWNSFLESKTEADGQRRVKELLSLLSSRVYRE